MSSLKIFVKELLRQDIPDVLPLFFAALLSGHFEGAWTVRSGADSVYRGAFSRSPVSRRFFCVSCIPALFLCPLYPGAFSVDFFRTYDMMLRLKDMQCAHLSGNSLYVLLTQNACAAKKACFSSMTRRHDRRILKGDRLYGRYDRRNKGRDRRVRICRQCE